MISGHNVSESWDGGFSHNSHIILCTRNTVTVKPLLLGYEASREEWMGLPALGLKALSMY